MSKVSANFTFWFLSYDPQNFVAAKTCGPPPKSAPGVTIRVVETGQKLGQNCTTNGHWLDLPGCDECGQVSIMRMR